MVSLLRRNLIDLPISYSLNYYWSNGFILSVFMVMQIITGVLLSFVYVGDYLSSFFTVMSISNDSFCGWCLRYWHIIGVNMLFILIFIHMGRSLYYTGYSKKGVWNIGFLLYLLVMGEAFTGYILPWHQMSYWAATVLTSIVDSVPIFGATIYKYIVGGFSVSGDTLVRILSVHICLGFIILGFMILHLFYLHKDGSSNPLYSFVNLSDLVYFHSYYTVKDLLLFNIVISLVLFWMFYYPDALVDIEAYLEADPLNTPVSIKPEWYFLAFYAVLRCIGSKLGGLILVLSILFFIWVPTSGKISSFSIVRQLNFWCIVSLFSSLIYLGGCHPEYPYLIVCQVFSVLTLALLFIYKLY
uniref:Cytochrome b n=2 Tax=Taenia pisiformis TaxID=85432 RepID=D3YLS5_TAEPI|nr:cytochrome b [Taenia pisiformis]ADC52487.1 cytochrome b [Taenia pisiformis]QQY84924.1 cytochrome b [Taenia pisiformis]